MKTKFNIKQEQLDKIFERDKLCVYCSKEMIFPFDKYNRKDSATIEHLNHIQNWDSVNYFNDKNMPVYPIIAICCSSCNSSRGTKLLREWFESDYCIINNININTVSKVVKNYIDKFEKNESHPYCE